MNKKIIASILAAVLMLSTAACGAKQAPDETPKQEETQQTVQQPESPEVPEAPEAESRNVTAYIGTSIFEGSMDPIKGFQSHGYPFINNALIRVTPDSKYVGDLADSWEISDDAMTYTYHLKDGITFSDGSAFTAEDVVFTYEQVKENPALNENIDLSRLDTVTAQDDLTVVFQLKEAYSPFFDTTAQLQIVPSDSYDSKTFDTMPIGTGAWKLVQYDVNQQMILEANETCFSGTPAIQRVTLVHMDPDTAFAAAKSGQLDIVMVGANYADETIDGMTLIPFETMDVRQISLTVQPEHTVTKDGKEIKVGSNVMSDKAVREALSIGISRQTIIDNAFNGVGKPAVNFTDNLAWASTDDYEDGRVDEAKQILEEAGWIDEDGDGIREKDGQRCTYDIYAPGDQDRFLLASALAENAQELGIELVAKTCSWDEATAMEYAAGIVWGWGQYSPTVLNSLFNSELFMNGTFDNVVGYENPEVDAKIQEALAAKSQEDAIQAWKDVQTLADADYPYLYLVNIEHCYFVNDDLDLSLDTQIPHPHGHGSPIVCNMQDWTWK